MRSWKRSYNQIDSHKKELSVRKRNLDHAKVALALLHQEGKLAKYAIENLLTLFHVQFVA